MKRIITFLLTVSVTLLSWAQSPLTSGYFNYHLIDRLEILNGGMSQDLFTGVKPYNRLAVGKDIANNGQHLIEDKHSTVDEFNLRYLQLDNYLFNSENAKDLKRKPLLKNFFPIESNLYMVDEERFKMSINPVLGFSGGKDKYDSITTYRNSRGVELQGTIGNKVGFYSYALENQVRFPNYLRERYANDVNVTGTTLAKFYKNDARDFFNVAGYITASPIEEITLQFGHDKNFIGNGHRSLILSDVATPNTFFKINTKVWKINYMNLYSVHTDYQGFEGRAPTARKYSALHHLSINLGKNFTLGLFENVIFDRNDTTESGGYEIDYLNPIIFYRAVEHGLNSSDNVMLGMDWKWNLPIRLQFYGQLIFDEFIKKEFFSQSSSWVNKWGYQAGLKYLNIANVHNLDAQVEVNQVRPHVYQHYGSSQNWIHYNQSLAHPLGANFREYLTILKYQPINRLNLGLLYSHSVQGIDSSRTSINYGGDITRGTEGLPNKENVYLFQGIENRVTVISFNASYMLWQNLFIDAGIYFRNQSNAILTADKTNQIFRLGLRLNLANMDYDL